MRSKKSPKLLLCPSRLIWRKIKNPGPFNSLRPVTPVVRIVQFDIPIESLELEGLQIVTARRQCTCGACRRRPHRLKGDQVTS